MISRSRDEISANQSSLVDGGRVPVDPAGVVEDGLGHDGHLVVAVSAENTQYH